MIKKFIKNHWKKLTWAFFLVTVFNSYHMKVLGFDFTFVLLNSLVESLVFALATLLAEIFEANEKPRKKKKFIDHQYGDH